MADGLVGLWRDAMDANVRYYESWGRLAGEWLKELQQAASSFQPTITLPRLGSTSAPSTVSMRASPGATVAPAAATAPAPAAVVLAADVGAVAMGAFLIENHLQEQVIATVEADAFRDEAGQEVAVTVEVLPRTIELAPGQATVVQVHAERPDVDGPLRSTLHVPGLVGTSVPLILRGNDRDDAAAGQSA